MSEPKLLSILEANPGLQCREQCTRILGGKIIFRGNKIGKRTEAKAKDLVQQMQSTS